MTERTPFQRLILRAVLRNVSPMVIRVVAVPDSLDLLDFDEVFRTVLGWNGLGFSFHVHGQEFSSFRRATRAKRLRDFQLRPREKFLYNCGAIDDWEWEFRLLDQQVGASGHTAPICIAGRGAAPPEYCGGPTAYRLLLKRQQEGESMCTPAQVETLIAVFSEADPDQPADTWNLLRGVLKDGFQSSDRRLQEYGPLKSPLLRPPGGQPTAGQAHGTREVARMKFRVQVVCLRDDGSEHSYDVMELERRELVMESLGLSLAEGKTILHGVQEFVTGEQTAEDLQRRNHCPHCGARFQSKESGKHTVNTVFGPVAVPNPRWHRCTCQTEGPKTFRPTAAWLKDRTSPELLYLETRWGSLIPCEKVAGLLKEVLPVSTSTNHETVREHLHAVAERMEAELGRERSCDPFQPEKEEGEAPLPDGPITVGIDGGYVRAAHKQGWFEVIAGRSVVAFRRAEGEDVPPAKCFGFVQTYDQKPRRRLWEVMKSQGMQENQQIVFMSDGGEDVRRVQAYLHPNSEHLIDWFHITMRLTVLQQQTKALEDGRSPNASEASKQVESIKRFLWHGNVEEALERIDNLLLDLDLIRKLSGPAEKLSAGLGEFETYIRNNHEYIPNYGELHRQGETISTAFVESTINQVVSRRFVKLQQMHWTLRGAHLLLQTRTKALNNELEGIFRRWYPRFRAEAQMAA